MGGPPVNKSAGKATKLPPPATALIPPPMALAKKRKMAVFRCKRKFYHEWRSSSKVVAASCSGAKESEPPLPCPRPMLVAVKAVESFLDNECRPVYERGVP